MKDDTAELDGPARHLPVVQAACGGDVDLEGQAPADSAIVTSQVRVAAALTFAKAVLLTAGDLGCTSRERVHDSAEDLLRVGVAELANTGEEPRTDDVVSERVLPLV